MRKAVVIILSACLAVAVFATTFITIGNRPEETEPQTSAAANAASKIVVWTKERDQKIFETTDSAVLNAVSGLMGNASWASGPEPLPALEGTEYILNIYDQDGQAVQYTMYYKSNKDITLFRTRSGEERAYEKADFPANSNGGGLSDYLNMNSVQ